MFLCTAAALAAVIFVYGGVSMFYEAWAMQISPGVDGMTFEIILNNMFVVLLLFGAVWFWRYCAGRLSVPRSRKMLVMYLIYSFFFLKEIFRIVYLVSDFSRAFDLSSFFTFCTIILPHGLVEFLAFVLVMVFGCVWLGGKRFKWFYLCVPLLLVIVAGILETTLTDYLFRAYLLWII